MAKHGEGFMHNEQACLTTIRFQLPNRDMAFAYKLKNILEVFGRIQDDRLQLDTSDLSFLPNISFEFADVSIPQIIFQVGAHITTVPIANTTGQNCPPKIPFQSITIDDFVDRMRTGSWHDSITSASICLGLKTAFIQKS